MMGCLSVVFHGRHFNRCDSLSLCQSHNVLTSKHFFIDLASGFCHYELFRDKQILVRFLHE